MRRTFFICSAIILFAASAAAQKDKPWTEWTEKDAMNLSAEVVSASALPVYAAQIEFRCEEEIALKGLVLRSMLRGRRKK